MVWIKATSIHLYTYIYICILFCQSHHTVDFPFWVLECYRFCQDSYFFLCVLMSSSVSLFWLLKHNQNRETENPCALIREVVSEVWGETVLWSLLSVLCNSGSLGECRGIRSSLHGHWCYEQSNLDETMLYLGLLSWFRAVF